MTTTRLQVRGLSKRYAVPVLSGIDFDLAAGEVHALVGENGAGKSTLCKIICGLVSPNGGQMHIDGAAFSPRDVNAAERAGVRMVRQELSVIPTLTVAENIFLDDLSACAGPGGVIRRAQLHARARTLMDQVGLHDVATNALAGSLGVGQQQTIEIARALARPCRILILDEPTAALTAREVDMLFERIRALAHAGTSVLYISHRLEELKTICDRITVLRDGRLIRTQAAGEIAIDDIVNLMVGASAGSEHARSHVQGNHSEVALTVEDLHTADVVRGVSFSVARGEILGFAGLMGAGRTETMRALFAADLPTSGQLFLGPQKRPVTFRSPQDAVAHGLAFVTENRKEEGLFLPLSIRSNIGLLRLRQMARGWRGVNSEAEAQTAKQLVSDLQVRSHSIEQPVGELSGGNQQKVLIARWLSMNPDILIFDEPTRGIDVGARREIYRLLRQLAEQGKAIIVVSSDMPELIELCDRVAVMAQGRIVDTFDMRGPNALDSTILSQKMLAAAFNQPTHVGEHHITESAW